jgi:BirA family biotin operon repressor/biotin-[acetyl-CoA-carboxylase] ligase
MLTAEAIGQANPGPWGAQVAVTEMTGSTNNDLMAAARAGANHGQVLFAEEQTGGRGRLGRQWHSPRGLNLYFSVLLHPPRLEITQFPPFALVAGLAVAEAINEETELSAKVKWPNDVLIDDRKVAGLLTEALPGSPASLVVGVGLNVNQVDFPGDLRDIATSLAMATGQRQHRPTIGAACLRHLHRRTAQAMEGQIELVLQEWVTRSSTIGRVVTCAGPVQGKALGVDPSGALLVADDAGTLHHIVAGAIEEGPNTGSKA